MKLLIALALLVTAMAAARGADDLRPWRPVKFVAGDLWGRQRHFEASWELVDQGGWAAEDGPKELRLWPENVKVIDVRRRPAGESIWEPLWPWRAL